MEKQGLDWETGTELDWDRKYGNIENMLFVCSKSHSSQ